MPQLANDNFNRADNADLGAAWDVLPTRTNCQIVGNRARAGALGNANSTESYNGITWPADHYSETTLGANLNATGAAGPAVRCSIADWTQYAVICDTAGAHLLKFVAGAFTAIADYTAVPPVTGDVVRLEVQGTNLTVYINGTKVLGPISDPSIATGRAGIYIEEVAAGDHEIDAWAGGVVDSTRSRVRLPSYFQEMT